MDKIKLMLIDWLCKDDPKKVIRLILKRHLKGYHLASNPVRKEKRSKGDAII